MPDIVERLRGIVGYAYGTSPYIKSDAFHHDARIVLEAAAEIEHLRKEQKYWYDRYAELNRDVEVIKTPVVD